MAKELFLNGDLNQMGLQRRFLVAQGISLKQQDVYPVVRDEDVVKALTAIWTHKVEGWWNYKLELIEHEICSKEEFLAQLKA